MHRLKVTYREEALLDLQDIYRIVFEMSRSHLVARRFIKRIEARCDRIGFVPRGGRPRDDLQVGLRTIPFEHSAIIAYKVEDNSVDISNIFYGGRDYEALYHDDQEFEKDD
jgi:toxin ParE1/3/4